MATDAIIPHEHNALTRFLFSRPIQPIPEEREKNIQDTSFRSRILWSWIFGMLRKGYDRVIVPEDITDVPEKDAMRHRFGDYKAYLTIHKPTTTSHFREIWALLYALRWKLLIAFLLKVLATASEIGMSLITRELIEKAEEITDLKGHESHGPVSGFTIGMICLDVIQMMCDLGSMYLSIMNSEYARTLMMACIHDKMLRLGPQQRHDFSAAKIMTLSSSDCRRGSTVFLEINSVLVLPVYLGATIGVLIYMIGVSGLAGVGLLLVGLILCGLSSFYVSVLRINSMPFQDRRISLTRETLKNITIIKFYAWEQSFLNLVKKLRSVETRFIRLIESMDALNMALAIATPNLAGALSFAVKIIISDGLEPSRAFPSLTLFQMFQPIFGQVSFAFISLADAAIAVKRLNAFFRLPELPSYVELLSDGVESEKLAARIIDGKFSWLLGGEEDEDLEDDGGEFRFIPGDAERDEKTVLENININLPRGSMTLVIGSVGTGKTSLLSAFTNTIPKSRGEVQIADDIKVTSVLSLWSQNASIRDNIVFGSEWDSAKYRNVVELCDLGSDFKLFSNGDLTDVGENGVTLSGGQRARLALARCLYADGDFLVLDDILSAMDSRVGNHIYRGLLQLAHSRGKTILFSTNNLKLIQHADFVVALDGKGGASISPVKGFDAYRVIGESAEKNSEESKELGGAGSKEIKEKVDSDGSTFEEKAPLGNSLPEKISHGPTSSESFVSTNKNCETPGPHGLSDTKYRQESNSNSDWDAEKHGGVVTSQMQNENRAVGSVDVYVLIRYFRLNTIPGFLMFTCVALCLMCYACSESMVNVVLNWWTSNKFHRVEGFNLGMYCLVVGLVGIFYALFANLLSILATESSTTLHNLALGGLYDAPVSFFQMNPLGRLMMRFTEDMVNLDTRLLAFARMSFMSMFSLLGSVIVVFVYVPWSLLCLIPIFLIAFVLMSFYRTSSREINRCQQLFDSKSMASVSEHIEGQEVILSFGMEQHSQFRLNSCLDETISATLHNEASNFWMAFRSGLLCEIIELVTIFLAVYQVFELNSSEVGTLISILPTVRTNLIYLFPMYALFDNQLNSVERLDEYATNLPLEGETMRDKERQDLVNWIPRNGKIRFENACLRYRDDLPRVLNDLNVTFGGGKKIGICGRTGAGKSTIISALFRLVELEAGVISIDDQDISELPLSTLRRALAIIPQLPVLFQGTIRSNLDPFDEHSDSLLLDVLDRAGFSASKEDKKFALTSEVQSEGTNFSLGERQMLALARAIVRGAKILVLDEATSAVDQGTDERIQQTIKTVFSDCTILCIAHRLETILDYDDIMVMGPGGKMLEVGPPRQLWENNGIFRSMCEEAAVGF